ncbi:hypothetical protein Bbelb_277810 [Branchiostoma belcheri]|nr:hypothetical protein Bbelb_277810 [Branchiostoma belcheri]
MDLRPMIDAVTLFLWMLIFLIVNRRSLIYALKVIILKKINRMVLHQLANINANRLTITSVHLQEGHETLANFEMLENGKSKKEAVSKRAKPNDLCVVGHENLAKASDSCKEIHESLAKIQELVKAENLPKPGDPHGLSHKKLLMVKIDKIAKLAVKLAKESRKLGKLSDKLTKANKSHKESQEKVAKTAEKVPEKEREAKTKEAKTEKVPEQEREAKTKEAKTEKALTEKAKTEKISEKERDAKTEKAKTEKVPKQEREAKTKKAKTEKVPEKYKFMPDTMVDSSPLGSYFVEARAFLIWNL